MKSCRDRNGLWYRLLKEKNRRPTEKEWARTNRGRMGWARWIGRRRRWMGKIRLVVRGRAIEDAVEDPATRRRFMRISNAK